MNEPTSSLSLAAAAASHGRDLALRRGTECFSFEEWSSRVQKATGSLPDGAFGIVARNDWASLALLYACLEERRPAVLLHARWDTAARLEACRRAGAGYLYDDGNWLPVNDTADAGPLEQFTIATSGSTGVPKLASLSASSFAAGCEASSRRVPLAPNDSWALSLSWAHVGGLAILLRCLQARATVHIPEVPGVLPSSCTHASVVPTQLSRLIRRHQLPQGLKHLLVGGAPLSRRLHEQAIEQGVPFHVTYGLTEFGSQVATSSLRPAWGAPLAFLDGVQARIDANGTLELRGPTAMSRYIGAPPLGTDWFRTSDRSELSAGGVRILGRHDNVIITGGENVSPELVEAALCDEAGIEDAAVIGIPDDDWGQRVVALLRVTEPAVDDSELRMALARVLPRFAIPKSFLHVASLPTLPNGKLDRTALLKTYSC